MTLTNGAFPGGRIGTEKPRVRAAEPRARLDAVFTGNARAFTSLSEDVTASSRSRSWTQGVQAVDAGNATRDDIPSHLVVGRRTWCRHAERRDDVADFYAHMCSPAGVGIRARRARRLTVRTRRTASDCKATDVLGGRAGRRAKAAARG
jgi:hypothetical protein